MLLHRMPHTGVLFFPLLLLLIKKSTAAPAIQLSLQEAQFRLAQFGYIDEKEEEIKNIKKGRSNIDVSVLRKAVTDYQQRFNLNVTGELDTDTMKSMSRARCGMSDRLRSVSGFKWDKSVLKYKISTEWTATGWTANDVSDAFKAAFVYWSEVTHLEFIEVFDDEKEDIFIEFRKGEHGDGYLNTFDGPDGTLGHAFFPKDGRIHFDTEEDFTEGSDSGYNLRIVAAHEIGHVLGLDHSFDNLALMAPYYAGYVPKNAQLLQNDDIQSIQRIYGNPSDKKTTTLLTTTSTTQKPTTPVATTTPKATTPVATTTPKATTPVATTTPKATTPVATTTPKPTPPTTVKPPTRKPVTRKPWVRPTVGPGKFDYCRSQFDISAAYMGKDGALYIIVPHGNTDQLFRTDLENNYLSKRYPRKFTRLFEYDQPGVDAMVWFRDSRSYYIFKGDDIHRYDPFGYYRQVIKNTKGTAIAAFVDSDNVIYVIFSGNSVSKFNPWEFTFSDEKPLDQMFKGVPTDVSAAAENFPYSSYRTYIYFFKGNEYWKANIATREVESGSRKVAQDFFGC